MARLDANDRFAIRLARELADSISNGRAIEYSGHDDQRTAYAVCVGAAGVLLNDLLQIIARLDGAP